MQLEMIKLAFLGFMVPNTDHSVHEIMQSSKTFGLEYTPGPGYEKDVYPTGGEGFIQKLAQNQSLRGYKLPGYYLSEEYVDRVVKTIK